MQIIRPMTLRMRVWHCFDRNRWWCSFCDGPLFMPRPMSGGAVKHNRLFGFLHLNSFFMSCCFCKVSVPNIYGLRANYFSTIMSHWIYKTLMRFWINNLIRLYIPYFKYITGNVTTFCEERASSFSCSSADGNTRVLNCKVCTCQRFSLQGHNSACGILRW